MDIRICFFPLPLQCQCDFCRSFKINLFELIRLEWKDQVGDELVGKDKGLLKRRYVLFHILVIQLFYEFEEDS